MAEVNGSALPPRTDPLDAVAEMVLNAITSRAAVAAAIGPDSRRDYFADFGHPKNPSLQDYADLYDRCGVAARAVQVWPRECWQSAPEVYEREALARKGAPPTAFEAALQGLGDGLGGLGLYKPTKGSCLWEVLERLDVQCGVGPYGVLLFGTDDGLPLHTPAAGVEERGSYALEPGTPPPAPGANGRFPEYRLTVNERMTRGRKLNYLRVFPAVHAEVTRYELNRASPRYMQPAEYLLTMMGTSRSAGDWAEQSYTERVHWSRVVHVADGVEGNETFGTPRLQHSMNRHLDLTKVYGSAAEMYWLAAIMALVVQSLPGHRLDVEGTKTMLNSFMNRLQRYMSVSGAEVKQLAPGISDPRPVVEVAIDAICIEKEIPKRIFMGSERGNLASQQDDSNWNDRVQRRRNQFVTPKVIVPVVNRLITLGCLPAPERYYVEWPDITAASALDQADRLERRTRSFVAFESGAKGLMTCRDYLVREAGYTEDEADAILAARDAEADGAGISPEDGLRRAEALAKGVSAGAHTLFSRKDFFVHFLGFSPEVADTLLTDLAEERREVSPEEQAMYDFASARLLGGARTRLAPGQSPDALPGERGGPAAAPAAVAAEPPEPPEEEDGEADETEEDEDEAEDGEE